MECNVCYEVITTKVSFGCSHQFCCGCCVKIKDNDKKVVCPLFRKDYKLFGAEEKLGEVDQDYHLAQEEQ